MFQFDPHPPPSRADPFPPHQSVNLDQSPITRSPFAQRQAGIAAFFVLGIIVLLGVMAYRDAGPLFTQADAETAVVRQLCADEVSQNYAAVYEMLSTGYRQSFGNQAGSLDALQQRDQQYGPVQQCSIASRDIAGTLFSFGGAVFQVSSRSEAARHTRDPSRWSITAAGRSTSSTWRSISTASSYTRK
jgi:hypothetical protein